MKAQRSNTSKILELLQSGRSENIDLAFQLCVGLQGNYSQEVADVLRKDIKRCLDYELEIAYLEALTTVDMPILILKEIPTWVGRLKGLQKLNLADN